MQGLFHQLYRCGPAMSRVGLVAVGRSWLFDSISRELSGWTNFVHEIKTALEKTSNTLAVLSPDYVDALSMGDEWAEALSIDP